MMIYIDSDYKCYVDGAEGRTAVETDAFDGKCAAYIEGYRYVPPGDSWTRGDGVVFDGEMVSPWVDSRELEAIQTAYEREQDAADKAAMIAALAELGVTTI